MTQENTPADDAAEISEEASQNKDKETAASIRARVEEIRRNLKIVEDAGEKVGKLRQQAEAEADKAENQVKKLKNLTKPKKK